MAKFFAATIVVIMVLSAIPIVRNTWHPLPNISTHGQAIDDQMSETMIEAGISFLASQFLLAWFIWKFSVPTSASAKADKAPTVVIESKSFPGGARGVVIAAFVLVGVEVLALGIFGIKSWAQMYFTQAGPDALPVQVQAGQFAFYFRYPGPDGKFGPLHPDLISEANQNFFGLDPAHDPDAKDDIVTAEMAIPVNREIRLLMHAKDVSHSFYVPALRIHQDFVPGLDLQLHFTATKTGKYEVVCSQLCGLGHYNMKAYLEVLSQDDFAKWLQQQAALQ
jgi:cytochrome c oxidase subunit II